MCCGLWAALLAHQVRKPSSALRRLKPVQPAIARLQVSKIFQHPELQHVARKPTPWIHPWYNVAYMADSVVLLQEPRRCPPTPTDPVLLCSMAFCCPGGTTLSFTHKRKRSLQLLAVGLGFTFDEPVPKRPRQEEQLPSVEGDEQSPHPLPCPAPAPPAVTSHPLASVPQPPAPPAPPLAPAPHPAPSPPPRPSDPALNLHSPSQEGVQECSNSSAGDSDSDFGPEFVHAEAPEAPVAPVASLKTVKTTTWRGEEMDLTEYTFWVSSSLPQYVHLIPLAIHLFTKERKCGKFGLNVQPA